MPHFAISCPPLPGHINPFCALGRALVRRGHRVTVFSLLDAKPIIESEGLRFVPLGPEQYPAGSLAPFLTALKEQQGFRSTLFVIRAAAGILRLILDTAPAAFEKEGIDAVLADQNEPAAASAAEHLGLPFVSICTSLPINRESTVPPSFTGWDFGTTLTARLRNRFGYAVSDLLTRNLEATLNEFRRRWGLRPLQSPDDSFSKLAQIAQMPAELDFPRRSPPANLYYTGPWFDDMFENSPSGAEFPMERLDGRPLLYASLGTLQSSHSRLFHVIAEACTGLNLQAVLAVGARGKAALPNLPGNHLVVGFAPQIKLLRRAALTITHAGMNTTAQALHFGSPLIAIPLAHDQPAIAARIKRSGTGLVFGAKELSVAKLRSAIEAMLEKDSPWRVEARRMQSLSVAAGGVERAADILEQSLMLRTGAASQILESEAQE